MNFLIFAYVVSTFTLCIVFLKKIALRRQFVIAMLASLLLPFLTLPVSKFWSFPGLTVMLAFDLFGFARYVDRINSRKISGGGS